MSQTGQFITPQELGVAKSMFHVLVGNITNSSGVGKGLEVGVTLDF